MRPWVEWLIAHKMRFMCYAILILLSPIYLFLGLVVGIFSGIADAQESILSDFHAIKEWQK